MIQKYSTTVYSMHRLATTMYHTYKYIVVYVHVDQEILTIIRMLKICTCIKICMKIIMYNINMYNIYSTRDPLSLKMF